MEWLNYHHLYYFWILRQEGSFTKAAQRLRVYQSSVSEQIALLEQRCSTALLDRSNRRQVRFTESGLTVLEYAQSIFETGQELARWLKNPEHQSSKVLRVGIQSGMSKGVQIEFLRPILNKGENKIEIVSGDQERLLRLLNEYKIDLILMASAIDERFTFQSYAHLLFSSHVCVASGVESKIKEKDVRKILSQSPLYLPSIALEIRVQIDAYFERHKIKPNIVGEMDDIALLQMLALSTNAVVLIPEVGIEEEVRSKRIKIHHTFNDIKKYYYAITRQQKYPNPLSGYLIKSMKQEK